jgi:RsiW-degrading membrane proteinase PrsW (M82 family)
MALLAVTALGPFVLPLIWRTPLLGRTGKWIGTLLVVAVTAWVCWQLSIGLREVEQLLEP